MEVSYSICLDELSILFPDKVCPKVYMKFLMQFAYNSRDKKLAFINPEKHSIFRHMQ